LRGQRCGRKGTISAEGVRSSSAAWPHSVPVAANIATRLHLGHLNTVKTLAVLSVEFRKKTKNVRFYGTAVPALTAVQVRFRRALEASPEKPAGEAALLPLYRQGMFWDQHH
jgi:hypothetical protein